MAKYLDAGSTKSSNLVEQKIQQIILANTNRLDLLTQVAEYLRAVFKVDVCLLYAYQQENGVVATLENCSLYPRSTLLPLLNLMSQQSLPEQEILEELEIDSLEEKSLGSPELQALMRILGLSTQGKGLIILGSYQQGSWTKKQQELLQAVAAPVAIALHQTQQQLEISYPYQKLVNQITQAIRDHQEISQILKQAITATSETLKATSGLILLLKYKDLAWRRAEANSLGLTQVTIAAQWAIPGHEQQLFPPQPAFRVSSSPLCHQAMERAPQPLITKDSSDNSSGLVMFPLMGAAGKAMPARVLGFLVLEYSPARQFLAGELELISSVSNQISYALIQEQTLRQVKAIVDERTAQLQASLEVQSRLYEKIRHQVDQLRQLNQIKDEFISAISHELRTPLTSMTLAIRMLQEEELTPEKQAKYLEVLAQQCQQEILLINDLLALQQLEENSPLISLEMTNIKPLLQQLELAFRQHWTTKGLKLQIEVTSEPFTPKLKGKSREGINKGFSLPEIHISTHADSLQRILAELLTNAGKYAYPDTTVILRVEQTPEEIAFRVANAGEGIPPAEQELIFEKFHRAQTSVQRAIPGTGLGLALVKPLVKHLQGKISVDSSPSDEPHQWITRFTVRLPQFLDGGKV